MAEASIFERNPWTTGLGIFVLLWGVAEVSSCAIGPAHRRDRADRARNAREVLYRVPSIAFHHGLAPGVQVEGARWAGYTPYSMRTNSLGFRDARVREVPLVSDVHRILLIGDSFTEGLGVPWESSFAGQASAALSPTVEILNAAAVSYSPVLYYAKVKHLLDEVGLEFDELYVFLDLSDVKDETEYTVLPGGRVVKHSEIGRGDSEPEAEPGFAARLLRHSAIAKEVGWFREALAERRSGRPSGYRLEFRPGLWTLEDDAWEEFGREGLRLAARHMDALHSLVSARGIPLTLAVYPWPDQIYRGDLDSRQVRFWGRWASERGVGFIDYFPRFIDGRPWREVLDRYFLPHDQHWTREGHAVIAQGLLERVRGGAPGGTRGPRTR